MNLFNIISEIQRGKKGELVIIDQFIPDLIPEFLEWADEVECKIFDIRGAPKDKNTGKIVSSVFYGVERGRLIDFIKTLS